MLDLTGDRAARERLASAALAAVGARPWDRSLAQLARAYQGVVTAAGEMRRAA